MDALLSTESLLAQPGFKDNLEFLKEGLASTPVLCVGAGGLGCEILKTLSLSGIKLIHVIDMDTIDVTNLNRQFLFRQHDIGHHKAEVAAKFVMTRVPGCQVIAHTKRIQEFGVDFYEQFPVIIAGLDNVEARRWLNRMVVELTQRDEVGNVRPETRHYLIDGGTEGLNGQARVIAPYESACYECTLEQLPKQVQYQMCTIANNPRLPEHCIAYVYENWPEEQMGKLDKDCYEHMNWIYEQACQRAEKFNIKGVTYKLTMAVVKNIIPAVASTNALIAAACVVECVKILTGVGFVTDNYLSWIGQAHETGINTQIIKQERIEGCTVCSVEILQIEVNYHDKLITLKQKLPNKAQLQSKSNQILITEIAGLAEHYAGYLNLTFRELIDAELIIEGHRLLCLCEGNRSIEVILKYVL